jgi:hypothetical protein
MQPGELVFYESARCLHGREDRLNGSARHLTRTSHLLLLLLLLLL